MIKVRFISYQFYRLIIRSRSHEEIAPNVENLLNIEAQDAKAKVPTLQTIMIWINMKVSVAWVNEYLPTFQEKLHLTSSSCTKGLL